MIKNNDIVIYTKADDTASLGLVRGNPPKEPAPEEYQIYPLVKSKGQSYKVEGDSEQVKTINVYMKVLKAKKTKLTKAAFNTTGRVTFTNFNEMNIDTLLNWPHINDETRAILLDSNIDGSMPDHEPETNLKKRKPTKGKGKKKKAAPKVRPYSFYIQEIDHSKIVGSKYYWNTKIDQERQR
jgi:hypothetical protein